MTGSTCYDPKGLIREAFAIAGIAAPECRSIFLDWALGLPPDRDTRAEVRCLLAHYELFNDATHPMIQTLQAALQDPPHPQRKGGRRARVPD